MQKQFDAEEVARYEKATWSRCAGVYMDGFGPLAMEAVNPLLDEVGISDGSRVLDVGTGPGLTAAAAQARGAETIGLDFSKRMLQEARRLNPDIEFYEASADSLPFEDGWFDAVVGNFFLHHSARPEKVLEEAFRVLKPGGKAGFTVWSELPKLEAFGLFLAAVEENFGAAELPHGPLFGVADSEIFHQMCRQAGFRDSSVRELPIAWRTNSIESFLDAFRDWADLETFPAEAQKNIENTVRKNSAAYKDGETLVMPNPAVLISAVK